MSNAEIVQRLRSEAREFAHHGENLYRVRAYRQAAFLLSQVREPIADLGPAGLRNLGLGEHLSQTVYQWALDAVEVAGPV